MGTPIKLPQIAAVSLGIGLLLIPAGSARADLFGADAGILANILAQAMQQTLTLADQLKALGNQINLMQTMLSQLQGSSYDAVQRLMRADALGYGALTQDISAIGYTLDAVNQDFRTVFPGDFHRTPPTNFAATSDRWQREILSAALVAARAQGSITTLEGNTAEAIGILSASRDANGEVAQLQTIAQMLGVIQSNLNTLSQSLIASNRVETNMAASTASERQLSAEKHRRNLDRYIDRGSPVTVYTSMPGIPMP